MKTSVLNRVNAVVCGFAGVFSLFVTFAVCRLGIVEKDMLSPDETGILPVVIAYCLIYGLISLFYAYCRFHWDREKNRLLVFCRKWMVYVLAAAMHGLSLVWMIPITFGFTDLVSAVTLPLGIAAFANLLTDCWPYIKELGIWVKEALFTKIRKKSV